MRRISTFSLFYMQIRPHIFTRILAYPSRTDQEVLPGCASPSEPQSSCVTKLATAMVAWEVVEDSHPQTAKALGVVVGSRPQTGQVEIRRLIRLRLGRAQTNHILIVVSCFLSKLI